MSTSLEKGSKIIEVKDTLFAAALAGIGIPFADPEHPCVLFETAKGEMRAVWQFAAYSSDRLVKTEDLLVAQKNPEEWVCVNTGHPLAYSLCGIINARRMEESVKKGTPLVGFSLPGEKVIYVYRDSRKHRRLIELKIPQL